MSDRSGSNDKMDTSNVPYPGASTWDRAYSQLLESTEIANSEMRTVKHILSTTQQELATTQRDLMQTKDILSGIEQYNDELIGDTIHVDRFLAILEAMVQSLAETTTISRNDNPEIEVRLLRGSIIQYVQRFRVEAGKLRQSVTTHGHQE